MVFDKHVVVITGGGSGIGAAAAHRFVHEGARVAICGRTQEKLDETAEQIGVDEDTLLAFQADIADPSDMQRLYRAVDDHWGRLDVVFVHAGANGVWAPSRSWLPRSGAIRLISI